MNNYEALKSFKRKGLIIDGSHHEEIFDKNLVFPKKTEFCHKCNDILRPVTFIKEFYSSKKKVLYRCPRCGKWETRTYIPPRAEYKPLTTEQKKRIELKSKGLDSEDIDEIVSLYKDEYKEKDKINEIIRNEKHKAFLGSSEAAAKAKLLEDGASIQEANEVCYLMRKDFESIDKRRKLRDEKILSDIRSEIKKKRLEEEADTFKSKLNSGEIIFIKKQRAFVEASTGKIVRTL